jgi:hypothetical protein
MTHQDFTIPSNHPDLQILCKLTNTDPDQLGPSCHGGSNGSYDANYMRVYDLRYWDETDVNRIEEAVKVANEQTSEYRFEITAYDDYEVEFDNDRSWPASFQFKSIKK